jgi:hypothetical protein
MVENCEMAEEAVNTEYVNDRQVGGLHYRSGYQHWDWAIDMCLGPIEYAATKYMSRWWKKHGPVKGLEDVEKAKHYVQKIKSSFIEKRYPVAFSRLIDFANAETLTKQFGRANGLSELEIRVCYLLAHWGDLEDLDQCLAAIDYIIQNPQEAAGKHGNAGAA